MTVLPTEEQDSNHDQMQDLALRPTSCNCSKRTASCNLRFVRIVDEYYLRDTTFFDVNEFCHDCHIPNVTGHTHHGNCDVEICPRCGQQMFIHVCEDIADDKYPNDAILMEFVSELPKGAKITSSKFDRKRLMQLFPNMYKFGPGQSEIEK